MNRKNQWPEYVHILIASTVFLAILMVLGALTARHNRRIDFTRGKVHSISRETRDVLARMKEGGIRVRAFFTEEDPQQRDFEILLKEAETHHPKFQYFFYDPDRSPSEARQYRVDAYQTTIVEYRGRQERFQGFSEEAFTNALIRAAHPRKRTLCFTAGHGESDLSDPERTGMAGWKQDLEDHQYEIKEIQLLAGGIPPECDALIMAGPRYELAAQELDLLQKFPAQGKGLLLLIDPMDPGTGKSYGELAKSFGILLGENVVVDKVSRVFGGDFLVPMVAEYGDHPVTRKFQAATFMPIARTVSAAAGRSPSLEVIELARTAPGSWAENDLKRLENGEAELNPETDAVGPVSLAAASELKDALSGARVVVVGDSDFLVNSYFKVSGNKDLALNFLQWLVRDDRWIAIRAREPRFEPLFLRTGQSVGIAAFAVAGVPLALLLAGSMSLWIRRRQSH